MAIRLLRRAVTPPSQTSGSDEKEERATRNPLASARVGQRHFLGALAAVGLAAGATVLVPAPKAEAAGLQSGSGYDYDTSPIVVGGSATPPSGVTLDVIGLISANGSATITNAPPTVEQNVGWKIGLFGTSFALGIAGYTLAVQSGNWLSLFASGTPPANNATSTNPDTSARVTLGTAGSLVVGPWVPSGVANLPGYVFTTGNTAGYGYARRNLGGIPGTWQAGDQWIWYAPDATHTSLWTLPNTQVVSVTAGGSLGVGTTTPAQRLDVAGAVAVNGTTAIDTTARAIAAYYS